MPRIYKRKSIRPKKVPPSLRKAYEELDKTARTLIQTDLKLHQANERFNQQIVQLHALHRIGAFINSTFDIEEILKIVSESMIKDLGFEKTGIVFLEKNGQKPMQSAYAGFHSTEFSRLLESFEKLLYPALVQEEEVCLQTVTYAKGDWRPLLEALSLASLILLPMRFKSRMIGFIVAGRMHVSMRLTEPERR